MKVTRLHTVSYGPGQPVWSCSPNVLEISIIVFAEFGNVLHEAGHGNSFCGKLVPRKGILVADPAYFRFTMCVCFTWNFDFVLKCSHEAAREICRRIWPDFSVVRVVPCRSLSKRIPIPPRLVISAPYVPVYDSKPRLPQWSLLLCHHLVYSLN